MALFLFIFIGTQKIKSLLNPVKLNILQFTKHKKWDKSKTNIKHRTLFFNGMINHLKGFDSSLLKIDTKWYKNIGISYIGFIAIKRISDYWSINSVNLFCLMIHEVIEHIEEKRGSKYLVLGLNNALMDKYKEIWREIKN